MRNSTKIKIALVSITALFGATTMISTASAEGVVRSNITVQTVSAQDAKQTVLAHLKNHSERQYHRLTTSTTRKVGNDWNVSVKTVDGLKVATAVVNAQTGKITFTK